MIRPTLSSAAALSSPHQVVPAQVDPSNPQRQRLSSNEPPATAGTINYQATPSNHGQGVNVFFESIFKILTPIYQLAKHYNIEPEHELKSLGDQINFGVEVVQKLTSAQENVSQALFSATYHINQLLQLAFPSTITSNNLMHQTMPEKISAIAHEIQRLQGVEGQQQTTLLQNHQLMAHITRLEEKNALLIRAVQNLQHQSQQAPQLPQLNTMSIAMSAEDFQAHLKAHFG